VIQPTLTTTRTTLAPTVPADLDALWAIWRDPEVRRYLFDDQPVSRERAAEVLDGCRAEAGRGLGLWTIREEADAAIIGCAGLMPADTSAEYDPTLRGLVEPIVALAPGRWGRGHAVDALRALVDYAFGPLEVPRLAGVTDVPNEASHRMLTRAGFVPQRECNGPHYRIRTYLLDRAAVGR
jgi:[ribosomal protein S5]-alanine N-acetyltransferase